jgi:hypothetical protein
MVYVVPFYPSSSRLAVEVAQRQERRGIEVAGSSGMTFKDSMYNYHCMLHANETGSIVVTP